MIALLEARPAGLPPRVMRRTKPCWLSLDIRIALWTLFLSAQGLTTLDLRSLDVSGRSMVERTGLDGLLQVYEKSASFPRRSHRRTARIPPKARGCWWPSVEVHGRSDAGEETSNETA